MRLINKQEAELVNTLTLALRLKSKTKIIKHFRFQYQRQPNDSETAFNYGICLGTYALVNPTDPWKKVKRQLITNKVLSACLMQRKDWWLARFVRVGVLHSLVDAFFQIAQSGKLGNYISIQPEEDIAVLIQQQEMCGGNSPYFLCAYIFQSYLFLYKNEVIKAIEFYKRGIEKYEPTKSPFNMIFLVHPFCVIIDFFRKFNLDENADEIKNVGLTLFPNCTSLLTR